MEREEFPKYNKIKQLGHADNKQIFENPADEIVIQEKMDGANFRFTILNDKLVFGSRTQQLTSDEGEDTNVSKNFVNCLEFIRDSIDMAMAKKYNKYIFYGECLAGNTVIRKAGGGRGDKANSMTIEEMYEFSKKKLSDRDMSWWDKNGMPSLFSLDYKSGKIIPNKMIDIIKSGTKHNYKIKTRLGYEIECSNTHPFLTSNGWKNIKQSLNSGDCVAISDLVKPRKKRGLGIGHNKIMKNQKDYLKQKGKCNKCKSKIGLELHHIDGNFENNNKKNWECLCRDCHKKEDVKRNNKKEYDYFFDNIISIKHIGLCNMYDIQMEFPNDNFIANNFVVHNCMISHTLQYDWISIPKFMGFDIYNTVSKEYVKYPKVKEIFEEIGLPFVPVLDVKTASNFIKDGIVCVDPKIVPITAYPPRSILKQLAEGVVFKNNVTGDYAKYVRLQFKEENAKTFGGVPKYQEDGAGKICAKYCTNARIEKAIWKFVDMDKPLDLSLTPMVSGYVYKDIWEEEWKTITKKYKEVKMFEMKKIIVQRSKAVIQQVMVNNALVKEDDAKD